MKKPKFRIGDCVIVFFDDHVSEPHDPKNRVEVPAHTIQAKIESAKWEGGGLKGKWVYRLDRGRSRNFTESELNY